MHILVINKSQKEASSLISALVQRGDRVDIARSLEEASSIIERNAPDMVILDTEQHSHEELVNLINTGKHSGHSQFLGLMEEEALTGYDFTLGLDEFVFKPYKAAELVARLNQLRWRQDETTDSELLKCGDLVIDLSKYEVRLADRPITLTLKEYELLCFLASNRGIVFSRKLCSTKCGGITTSEELERFMCISQDCEARSKTAAIHLFIQ